jgi:chemotaxis methyl-accepting protein methylase
LGAAEARLKKLDTTMAKFVARLRREPSEWDELWCLYDQDAPDSFFRYPAQFETLGHLISEKAALASERTLRVLSVGARRGHEACSLAMLLSASGLSGKGWKIRIDGLDMSAKLVRLAREAKFTGEDLAFLEPSAARKWFEPRSGAWRFRTALAPEMEFFQANPMEIESGPLASLEGAYDVILARGLAFDCPDSLVWRLARNISSLLAQEGLLLTAPGELWPPAPDVWLEERDGVAYLRKSQAKTKANVFFQPKKAPSRGQGPREAPAEKAFGGDKALASLAGKFHELLGPDPDEARETAVEFLSREMESGQTTPGAFRLMLMVEERLGRAKAVERLRAFLEAWEGE